MSEDTRPTKVVLRAVYNPELIALRIILILSVSVIVILVNVPNNIIINPMIVPSIPSVIQASDVNHSILYEYKRLLKIL
jgi:hypothetical protein